MGQQLGNILAANAQKEALAKGLDTASKLYDAATNPTATNDQITAAASQYIGIPGLVGMNAVQGLANLQNTWNTASTQMKAIDNQLANTSDPTLQKTLTDQKSALQNQMDTAHQNAMWMRTAVGNKGADLTGLGAGDDVSQYIQNSNAFKNSLLPQSAAITSAIQSINNATGTYDNAQNELNSINAQLANPDENTDVAGLQTRVAQLQKDMDTAHADAEWTRNSMFNPSLLGTKGQAVLGADGNYNSKLLPGNTDLNYINNSMVTNAVNNAYGDDKNKYQITLDYVAKDPNIANYAKAVAYAAARDKFNPTQYVTQAMLEMSKAGLSAENIAKLQPILEKQANDIGSNYEASILAANNGDTRSAALYALGRLGGAGLNYAQLFAPKNNIDKVDTGDKISYNNISTSPFGGTPTFLPGPTYVKGNSPGDILNAQLTREQLKQNNDQFSAKMQQSQDQFNKNFQLAQVKLGLEKDNQVRQQGLQQLQIIAGMANNYKATISGYQDQISAIIKSGNGMLTQADKDSVAALNQKINNTTMQYESLNKTLANSFGIQLQQSDNNSQSTYQPSAEEQGIADWIDKAKAAGATADKIKQTLKDKGYGNRFDSWVY